MVKKYKKNFYAYKVDGESGIVNTWSECEDRVMGKAARYRGFATRSEAEAWLEAGAPYEQRAARKAEELAGLPGDAVYFDSGTGAGTARRSTSPTRTASPCCTSPSTRDS